MWAVLRRPRWLLYLVLALVFGVVAAGLGAWQWQRHEGKVERRDVVEANYDSAPRPLVEVLPRGQQLRADQQWTRVVVHGTYQQDGQHLVRNRPYQGVYGYEVLVPLVLGDGQVLTVDRGWVQNAPRADQLPEVPPAPQGEVAVSGWLRPSEPDLGRDLPEGQLASIDLPRLSQALDEPLVGAYLVLGAEQPAPAASPALLEAPDTRLGSHFAYALQWWLTVPVGLVLVLVMARREAQDEAAERGETLPAGRPSSPRRGSRARKVRIWDEEDA